MSFPGADFDKGAEGHRADLTDHTGAVIASSGTEMAEALRQWLVQGWLEGDESLGESHPPRVAPSRFNSWHNYQYWHEQHQLVISNCRKTPEI